MSTVLPMIAPSLTRHALVLALFSVTLSAPAAAQREYTIERELRLGELDGPAALTEPGGVAVSRAGIVVISQPQEHLIRLFSPEGRILPSIGRRGSGPGEFRTIVGMGVIGDTVWATDFSQARLSYFSLSGDLLDEVSWPGMHYMPGYPLPDGTYGAAVITVGGVSPVNPSRPWPVTRFARDGTLLDTIALLHTHASELSAGAQPVVNPVGDGAISSLSPNGTEFIVVDRRIPRTGDRGAYTISWIRMPEGDTLQRRSVEYRAHPIPREQIAQLTHGLASSGAPREYVDHVRDLLRRQAFLPPVSHVYAADGAVWLARETLGRADVRWERFTRTDGLTGSVTLPSKSRIVAEHNGRVWVLEKDDFDVPYVTRYRFQ